MRNSKLWVSIGCAALALAIQQWLARQVEASYIAAGAITVNTAGNPSTSILYPAVARTGYVGNAGTGDIDLFTCPTGKRCHLRQFVASNTTAGTLTWTPKVKIAGTYYRFASALTLTTGNSSNVIEPYIMEAGQVAAVTTNGNGLNLWVYAIEFPDSIPLKSVTLTSFSAGDNIIYTVPAGKTAFPIGVTNSSNGPLLYGNDSGANRTAIFHQVPNGSSTSTATRLNGNGVVTATGNVQTTSVGGQPVAGQAGDFYVINLDAGTASQWCFLTVIEQ
jgi:hypothetical protein